MRFRESVIKIQPLFKATTFYKSENKNRDKIPNQKPITTLKTSQTL
ncbi:hypothetical protein JCM19294_355 [Nonlabens tegetincola]|uniref:Uncharacterized protein n=1 Tax=Nonlabens tegetincola TaxID=323273 RepID=A0A090QQP9_9FLAO|nr:hypothetical protein JCM19294_355 [Nonlabens tegetincola]